MMHIVSWNLRYDKLPDSISVSESLKTMPGALDKPNFTNATDEQPWSTRRLKVAQQLLTEDIVLAGFQEAVERQVLDMRKLLEGWDYIGVGREDGASAGEFGPIFYKKDSLKPISNDTFWLSDTPFSPSKYPGAGCKRICTVVRFELLNGTGPKTFTMLNTHLDHRGGEARKFGASLVLARARYEAVKTGEPVFLTGDFNSTASGKDSSAYKVLTGSVPPMPIPEEFVKKFSIPDDQQSDFRMIDMRGVTPPLRVSGNFATFTNFKGPENTREDTDRIDFVFGGSNGNWSCEQFKVPSALSDDGILASDHRPVFAKIVL